LSGIDVAVGIVSNGSWSEGNSERGTRALSGGESELSVGVVVCAHEGDTKTLWLDGGDKVTPDIVSQKSEGNGIINCEWIELLVVQDKISTVLEINLVNTGWDNVDGNNTVEVNHASIIKLDSHTGRVGTDGSDVETNDISTIVSTSSHGVRVEYVSIGQVDGSINTVRVEVLLQLAGCGSSFDGESTGLASGNSDIVWGDITCSGADWTTVIHGIVCALTEGGDVGDSDGGGLSGVVGRAEGELPEVAPNDVGVGSCVH
jgi:hypothetical protein